MIQDLLSCNDLLGDLVLPNQFTDPIEIGVANTGVLVNQLETMLVIRFAEEKIADMIDAGKVHCPCHLGIGQEAIAVGVAAQLRKTDRVFGGHRGHSQFLAVGGGVYELFAEVLGRITGCSHGMGGSQHLYDKSNGFWGSVPIVAATIPIATGAALAARMDKKGDLAVSFFGDCALEEGASQESLNLAAALNLPVVFVCENNLFASHMHIGYRQPANSTARFAQAHQIPFEILDGNDVVAVSAAMKRAADRARENGGPTYLECVTYRWRGHVGPREDMDVGVKRSEDLLRWKDRDPVRRLAESLESANLLSAQGFIDLKNKVQAMIDAAWLKAEGDPFPPNEALLDWVYFSE